MLSDDEKQALSKVRLEHAIDCIEEAEKYRGASNRSYYALFHAIRSVLALDGIDRKHHSGVISEFRRLYIHTGIFDTEWSNIIGDQFDNRSASDYNDFYTPAKEEVEEQVASAKRFLTLTQSYLQKRK